MWKKLTLIAGVLLLLIGLLVIAAVLQRSQARTALAAYKAELRAQGEALTWEDLGYPPPAKTNSSFDAFLAAVKKLGKARPSPAELDHMHCVAPGTAQVGWAAPHPLLSTSARLGTNAPTWEQFISDMDTASNTLAEIRASLQNPPDYFPINLTNPLAATPKNPVVEKRNAAQWLAADSLAALHEGDLDRAHADLHALTQMVQLHRADPTLVSAMIRVAISGLGLSATWEALPAMGWSESSLAELQKDWEAIDLVDAMEQSMAGDRVLALQILENAKTTGSTAKLFNAGSSLNLQNIRDAILFKVFAGGEEKDQLLYMQMYQQRIEILRQLNTNESGCIITRSIAAQDEEWNSLMRNPFARYRYPLTLTAMPNYFRACQTVLRNETQRRMTITGIALERYRLRAGRFPASLDALVPEFVISVPIDPMSGQSFGYRTNADGSFTLYSVGEDGQDNGGDATTTNAVTSLDLWSGQDAVWPQAVTNEPVSNP